MTLRTTLVAVLALAGATVATAQTTEVIGRIDRIVPEEHVLVLNDGRMYRVTPSTVLYVDRKPVTLSALAPGQSVVIRSGEAVTLQNGEYVVVNRGATIATPGGSGVVVTPPATATQIGVRQTLYARVTDVDDDGTVKVDTGRDSFEVELSRDAVRQIREGDTVQLDMTVVPAGRPAASPLNR